MRPVEEKIFTLIEDIKNKCFEIFKDEKELNGIVVSSLNKNKVHQKEYYSLIIEKNKISLTENKPTQKTNFDVDLTNNKVEINNQEVDGSFLQNFMQKIKKIGQDITNKKANVYKHYKK